MSVGAQGAHTIWSRGQGGSRHHLVWLPPWPPRVPFGLRVRDRKIWTSGFGSSNSENISRTTFLKLKIAENRELALGILSIG